MSSHRQRLIDEAETLFRTNGFHAVSLDTILRSAGTTKTTFYKHFESKDELALICLRNCRQDWWASVDRRLAEAGVSEPLDCIRMFFELLGERFGDEARMVFPSVAAVGEFPHPTDPRHVAGRESLREIEDRLLDWARAAGAPDPERLAAHLAVTAKGAILHELANRGGRTAGIARDMTECLLDMHFEPTGA